MRLFNKLFSTEKKKKKKNSLLTFEFGSFNLTTAILSLTEQVIRFSKNKQMGGNAINTSLVNVKYAIWKLNYYLLAYILFIIFLASI